MAKMGDRVGAGCMVLFGLPFSAVGVGAAIFIGWTLWEWQVMGSWVETPAYIEYAELQTHRGDDSTTYSVEAHGDAGRY